LWERFLNAMNSIGLAIDEAWMLEGWEAEVGRFSDLSGICHPPGHFQ